MTKLIHMSKIVQSPGILPKPSPIIPIIHTLFKSFQPFNATYVTYVTNWKLLKTIENCCQESFWGRSLSLWSFCLLDSPSVALSGPQWPSVALRLLPGISEFHVSFEPVCSWHASCTHKRCWAKSIKNMLMISTYINMFCQLGICSSKVTNFGEC